MARVWVWVGHLWSDRVKLALENYGDRLTDVSIFAWRVDAAGKLMQTFDPDLLAPYRERWPHLRFWAAFYNDGNATVFTALRNTPASQAQLTADLSGVLDARPWLSGIDIDLERGGGSANSTAAEALFRKIADVAHARHRECSAALPPLTASGSVGGEGWVRYRQLGQILDRFAIMSYDFAWSGSAPGPVSPGFWMKDVYDWATSQVPASKLMMGVPLYSYFWSIHNYPSALGNTYRGVSGTYYAAWQNFTGLVTPGGNEANPDGPGTHHHIGWLAFRDADSGSAHGLLHVYDWRYAPDWDAGSNTGVVADTYDGHPYIVRYGRPSGVPLWSVADNSAPASGAAYALNPRRVRSNTGALVSPKKGFTLTVEVLKRDPVAATIIDDNAGTAGQLDAIYTQASGAWARWAGNGYYQYRGSGRLDFKHDFGEQALFLQVRGQFASSGWAGVTVRGIQARVNPAGVLEVWRGTSLLASTTVTARPVGQAAGSGRFALGLRVRENSAKVYYGLSENTALPRVLNVATTPLDGTAGIVADATFWVDHVYLGDGWWYQPREAVQAQIGSEVRTLGRFPRTGITWDAKNRFRPDTDVDEPDTRTGGPALDWVYEHWVDAPLRPDVAAKARIHTIDHDVWVGRVFAVDRDGASIVYWSDAETVARWRDRAQNDWGLSGIALWTLGQEDVRTWERLAGGELPPGTKRLNS
ncbi:glycosyl hydrolase family 18 protein [Microbacterium sp.]|uniref:glycosyl hydrolase family 18 protein n=1 Tax=Microbacterium sp. TaxID=51671 RepID=UPI003A8EE13D